MRVHLLLEDALSMQNQMKNIDLNLQHPQKQSKIDLVLRSD